MDGGVGFHSTGGANDQANELFLIFIMIRVGKNYVKKIKCFEK